MPSGAVSSATGVTSAARASRATVRGRAATGSRYVSGDPSVKVTSSTTSAAGTSAGSTTASATFTDPTGRPLLPNHRCTARYPGKSGASSATTSPSPDAE